MMNRLRRGLLLAGLAWVLPAAVPAAVHKVAHDASHGVHGMVLFGDQDGLYASHLPLFRAPHDVQAVLQLRLADSRQDRELRARMQGATALWTIAPERFELSRLGPDTASPLRGFGADVYSGHFERDGKRQYERVQFVVEKVVMFQRLDPSLRARSDATYFPVGKFLVKRLDSRPDVDHIVKLAVAVSSEISVAKPDLSNPEQALRRVAPVLGTVYFETGDLR